MEANKAKDGHLDEGRCRFNCRTAKENFIAGFEAALDDYKDDFDRRQQALEAWGRYRRESLSR